MKKLSLTSMIRQFTVIILLLPPLTALAKPEAEDLFAVDLLLDQKITMRDGIHLSANIYHPKGYRGKRPTIVFMTPYINERTDNHGWYLAQRGFTFVAADVRGRGNSEGQFSPFKQEAKDGHDLVEWAAQQHWSNGKIGMLGGSYVGYTQWATLKEFPPHLKTILPIASVGPGIDFPMYKNISYPYVLQWLTFTGGKTGRDKIFLNDKFWSQIKDDYYENHRPFQSLPKIFGSEVAAFSEWLAHPTHDDYWKSQVPTESDYKKIDIPILTLTGVFDSDYPGAMTYYRNHMEYGKKSAVKKHYLIIGPWDHGGTRRPRESTYGIELGKASVIDMPALYHDWFDWTLRKGKKPEFLRDRVAYYSLGENQWHYAGSLDEIPDQRRRFYLTSLNGQADQVFSSGRLTTSKPVGDSSPDTFESNPLTLYQDVRIWDSKNAADQAPVMRIHGDGLIYHSDPLAKDTRLAGEMRASLWLSMNVPDADLEVSVYEIHSDGSSTYLAGDLMRARYRHSLERAQLVVPDEVDNYTFDGFYFQAKTISKGSRIRLVLTSLNSRSYQKNYQGGGDISTESGNDARTGVISLHHTGEHPSFLELPLVD